MVSRNRGGLCNEERGITWFLEAHILLFVFIFTTEIARVIMEKKMQKTEMIIFSQPFN